MAIQQSQLVAPPQPSDKMLKDFSQIIQSNFLALFQSGHVHKIVTSNPSPSTGNIGDIYLIDGATKSIAVKLSSGWYTVALSSL